MFTVATALKEVMQATGNTKQTVLKKYANNEEVKRVLQFIYNPYVKTGISDKKYEAAEKHSRAIGPVHICVFPNDVIDHLLNRFATCNTGTEEDLVFVAKCIAGVNKVGKTDEIPDMQWLLKGLVTKNLKIGITATTLNKVYGAGFIPITGCMLGTLYSDVKPETIKWPCIVTTKLDGIRRLLIKKNGVSRMYSRSGHEDVDCVDILAEAEYLPDNTVYDGELLAIGNFANNIAERQATSSIANSGGAKTGLTFNVFDMLPVDEYEKGLSQDAAVLRKIAIALVFSDPALYKICPHVPEHLVEHYKSVSDKLTYIKPVFILDVANSFDDVTPIVQKIWNDQGEGVMLNTFTGHYEVKRSKQLLKVKHVEEAVKKVIDFEEGTGKNKGSLGSLIVDHNGVRVGVGSGLTDAQRRDIWDNKMDYIGKYIEIDTFGESTNMLGEVSLNCPIFKRFVGTEE